MKRPTCPYLGIKEDPSTALNFPSDGNLCHHASPVSPVRGSYQAKTCLTSNHLECPVYRAAHPVPLPPEIAPDPARVPTRRVMALAAIPLLLAGVAALTLGWNLINARFFGGEVTSAGEDEGMSIGFLDFASLLNEPTYTPFAPRMPVAAVPTNAGCPAPHGWIPYVVNPTDSLFRLSVIYGLTVEQLQQVNCLGNSTVILPGQVIYIPYVPTETPVGNAIPNTGVQGTQVRPPVIQPPGGQTVTEPTRPRSTRVSRPTPSTGEVTAQPTATPVVILPTATSVFITPTAPPPTNTLPPLPTATRFVTSTPRPTNTVWIPTRTPRPTNTALPTSTVWVPTRTPRPTRTPWWPFPTRTPRPSSTPVPSTPTSPPPTATEPAPTATNPPPPTATEPPPPPPTATDPPPPQPTPTDPPPPTATDPPPPPPTEVPPATSEPETPEPSTSVPEDAERIISARLLSITPLQPYDSF